MSARMRKVSVGVQKHIKQHNLKHRIQNWHKSVILFGVLLVYLIFGAIVFSAIEKDAQLQAQKELNMFLKEFVQKHNTCMNFTDLQVYVDLLLEAVDKGAVLNKEFRSDENIEHLWNLPNAFFFSSTVVTTIGYGNLAPHTTLGRIMCILYALIGIPMTGWMLSSIGQTFHDKWYKIGKILRKITHRFKSNSLNSTMYIFVVFLLAYSTIIVIPAAIIAYAEDWNYVDAHYFCFISLTTIGFGDLAPQTLTGSDSLFRQWLHTVLYVTYLLLGLSLLSVALTAFLRKHQGQFKSAGRRLGKFVTHSARQATVRMKEATERGGSPADTPKNSFKRRHNETDFEAPSPQTPKLLKVVTRIKSGEYTEPPTKITNDVKNNSEVEHFNPLAVGDCSAIHSDESAFCSVNKKMIREESSEPEGDRNNQVSIVNDEASIEVTSF